MCERLSDIRLALHRFAAGFDGPSLGGEEARRAVADAAAVEACAVTVKALAAARATDAGAYGSGGEQSAAEGLAEAVGVGAGAARELIVTGRRLADQPEVAAAAKAGALSPAKVALVANAVAADPAAAGRLVELAGRSSVASVREECARVKAAVGDAEQRRRAIRARRRLSAWTDVEGVWHLAAQGNPEDGAQVMAALSPGTEARFRAARLAGERESPAAYAFDALVELARERASSDDHEPPAPPASDSASALADASAPATPTDREDGDARAAGATSRSATGCTVAGGGDSPQAGSPDAGDGAPGAEAPSGANWSDDPRPPELAGRVHRRLEGDRSGSPSGGGGPPDEPGRARAGPLDRLANGDGRRRRGAPVKLLVRIDYDTFLRGAPREGETCELVGYGPIAVSAVHELLESGDPFVAAILTKGKALVGVAHLGRRPRAAELSALQWLYPSCAVRGCAAQARLEVDHRVEWSATHFTAFDLLDRLCHRHHALKTRDNWALVVGTGERDFVAPGDPRHPRHAARPARA